MPRRKLPKPEIIESEQLKTAAGGGGSGGGSGGGRGGGGKDGFRPGDSLLCKVVKPEPGGYAVMLVKYNLDGFLPTQALLTPGEEILCQFVCVHNHRILLSARFSNDVSKIATTPQWQEQLLAASQKARDANARARATPFLLKRATDLILPPIDRDSLNEFKIADYDTEWLITDLEGGMKTGCVK